MKTRTWLLRVVFACMAAFGVTTTHAQAPDLCNLRLENFTLRLQYGNVGNPLILEIVQAVQAPASNPALLDRLQRPVSVSLLGSPQGYMLLDYRAVSSAADVITRLVADTELLSPFSPPELINVNTNSDANSQCRGQDSPPPPVIVREYYNSILDHYFLSSSITEEVSLDSGGGGPGWSRTGQAWFTYAFNSYCANPGYQAVFRFYGTPGIGPNSHFFTLNADECRGLRAGTGWTFEGLAFAAAPPTNGSCQVHAATTEIYRLYNNRFAENDSNHRYTSSLEIYQQMQALGWIGEGIVMCFRGGVLEVTP